MRSITWIKMLGVGGVMCIGGPALVWYVTPTEEQLIARYNPDLRKRALENRQERQEDFDKFVTKLKAYSKSDKPIWTVWEEEGEKAQLKAAQDARDAKYAAVLAANARKDEIRDSVKKS